jgi:hypothetical protein
MTYITAEADAVFGAMYFNENATAQTPVAGDDIGITQMSTGVVQGFTFEAGSSGNITATADNGGDVTVTIGAHSFSTGDVIMLSQSSSNGSYDITGIYVIQAVGATTVDITFADWDSTETGVWQVPSQLKLTQAGISNQEFEISWSMSGSVAGTPSGDIVDWGVCINATKKVETYSRRTLSTGSVWGSYSAGAILSLSTGDVVSMFFNSDDVNALTHRVGGLRVQRT